MILFTWHCIVRLLQTVVMANNDQIKQARLRGILKKDIEGIKSAQAQQAVGTETTQQSSQPTR